MQFFLLTVITLPFACVSDLRADPFALLFHSGKRSLHSEIGFLKLFVRSCHCFELWNRAVFYKMDVLL